MLKFNHERTIRLVYHRNEGNMWQFKSIKIDQEIETHFGKAILAPLRQSYCNPWVHETQIFMFLAENCLDGGTIYGEMSNNHYNMVFTIKERKKRPKQQIE